MRRANPEALIVKARSTITVEGGVEGVAGKRVLVVEDGPSLTHGDMGYGAGVVAARRAGAMLVDPRPWAHGSMVDVYKNFPHIGALLPAMGYSDEQRHDLEQTINASDAELVLVATPIDLRRVCNITKPAVRVFYELEEPTDPRLVDLIVDVLGFQIATAV